MPTVSKGIAKLAGSRNLPSLQSALANLDPCVGSLSVLSDSCMGPAVMVISLVPKIGNIIGFVCTQSANIVSKFRSAQQRVDSGLAAIVSASDVVAAAAASAAAVASPRALLSSSSLIRTTVLVVQVLPDHIPAAIRVPLAKPRLLLGLIKNKKSSASASSSKSKKKISFNPLDIILRKVCALAARTRQLPPRSHCPFGFDSATGRAAHAEGPYFERQVCEANRSGDV